MKDVVKLFFVLLVIIFSVVLLNYSNLLHKSFGAILSIALFFISSFVYNKNREKERELLNLKAQEELSDRNLIL